MFHSPTLFTIQNAFQIFCWYFTLLSHTPLLLIILNPDLFKQILLTACLLTTTHPSCFHLWHLSTRKIWGKLAICLPFAMGQQAKLSTAVTTSCCHTGVTASDGFNVMSHPFSFTLFNQLILSTSLLQKNPKKLNSLSLKKTAQPNPNQLNQKEEV